MAIFFWGGKVDQGCPAGETSDSPQTARSDGPNLDSGA